MSGSPAAVYTIEEEEPDTITVDPHKYGGMTEGTREDFEAFFVKQGATEADAKRWTGKLFEDHAPLHCAQGSRHFKGSSAFEQRAQREAAHEYEYKSAGPTPRAPSPPFNEGIHYEFQSEEPWEETREYRGPDGREYFHASRSNNSPGFEFYQPKYRPEPHSSRSTRHYPRESSMHGSPPPRSPMRERFTFAMPDRTKSSSSRPTETYSTAEGDYINVEYSPERVHHSSSRRHRNHSPPRPHGSSQEPPMHESSSHRHRSDRTSSSQHSSNRDHRSHETSQRPFTRSVSPLFSQFSDLHFTAEDYEPSWYTRRHYFGPR